MERKLANSSCTGSPNKTRAPRSQTASCNCSRVCPSKYKASSCSLTRATRSLKQSNTLGFGLFNVLYTNKTSPRAGNKCNLGLNRTIVSNVIHTRDFLYKYPDTINFSNFEVTYTPSSPASINRTASLPAIASSK